MSEKRVDPEDGAAYTWDELKSYYTGKYKKKEIEEYWYTCKLVKKKNKKTGQTVEQKKSSPDGGRRGGEGTIKGVNRMFEEIAELAGRKDSIKKEEFVDFCFKHLHIDLTEAELLRVFEGADSDNDGLVTKKEFETAMSQGSTCSQFLQMLCRIWSSTLDVEKFQIPDDFDYTKSTTDNYKVDTGDFEEAFKLTSDNTAYTENDKKILIQARGKMDYAGGYHKHYSPQRQVWQNAMVKKVIYRTRKQPTPWLVYTCGTPGAGKGYVMSWMSESGYFPLERIVHVDPDYVKMQMPEWPHYKEKGKESVDECCGQEANFIADLCQKAAQIRGQNIWRDSTLINADMYKKEFEQLHAQHPEYKIAIFYITAAEHVVRERIQDRAKKTGRTVDEDYIKNSFEKIQKSLTIVGTEADFTATIDNSGGGSPVLLTFQTVDRSHNWSVIKSRFARVLVAPEAFPQSLAPLFLARTENFEYKVTDNKSVRELVRKSTGDKVTIKTSAESPITLDAELKERILIPKDAVRFCFIYPCAGDDVLAAGGFMYFKKEGDVAAINYISISETQYMIQFESLERIDKKTIGQLKQRLENVTLDFLKDRGVQSFAFILPGETVGNLKDHGHGGFAYKFKDEGESRYFAIDCFNRLE